MRKFFKNESGATAIEYGLIAALIAVAIITAVHQSIDRQCADHRQLKSIDDGGAINEAQEG